MTTFLLTVQHVERTTQGLRLSPGIRSNQIRSTPAVGKMTQGASLELRRPDGARRPTHLVTYGISAWKREDGSICTNEDPANPEIKIILPEDLSMEDVAIGTEIWLL